MKKRLGLTLIELLIGMLIFGIILTLASVATVNSLRLNVDQEAAVAAQARLRRVSEVIGQEIRGSLFGGLASEPYAPGQDRVSFYLLEQGAGYVVQPYRSGNDSDFKAARDFDIISVGPPGIADGDTLLMVSNVGQGEAVALEVLSVREVVAGSDLWRVTLDNCTNSLDFPTDTLKELLVFNARKVGFRYDGTSRQIELSEDGQRYLFAANMTGFEVGYIYLDDDDAQSMQPNPYLDPTDSFPLKSYTDLVTNETYRLIALQITLASEEKVIGGRTISRVYSADIPLLERQVPDNPTLEDRFHFQGVQTCEP